MRWVSRPQDREREEIGTKTIREESTLRANNQTNKQHATETIKKGGTKIPLIPQRRPTKTKTQKTGEVRT